MTRTLEDLIDSTDSMVDMLRNMQTGPNVYPVTPEFTNWQDEQWAWQNTCILFDLSYHMVDLRLEGRDASHRQPGPLRESGAGGIPRPVTQS